MQSFSYAQGMDIAQNGALIKFMVMYGHTFMYVCLACMHYHHDQTLNEDSSASTSFRFAGVSSLSDSAMRREGSGQG